MPISRLVHDRKGSGEPVVLIHGIGHRRQAWTPVFERLAEHYDVIAVDLAGFGDSPNYPADVAYDMDNACRDLLENFDEWGIERPHVVGNSLGGAIALELASRGLASSATVLSPAGFFRRFDLLRALAILVVLKVTSMVPDVVLRAVARRAIGRKLIGQTLYAHPERHDFEATYGDALALKRCTAFFSVVRAALTYRFDRPVNVPTTVAWGTRDLILPPAQAEVAEARLPNAVHVPLEDAGHVPMYDVPEEVVELVHATVARSRDGGLSASA